MVKLKPKPTRFAVYYFTKKNPSEFLAQARKKLSEIHLSLTEPKKLLQLFKAKCFGHETHKTNLSSGLTLRLGILKFSCLLALVLYYVTHD